MSSPLCGIETIDTSYALVCDHLYNLPIVLCQLIRDYLNEYQTVDGDRRKELWDRAKAVNTNNWIDLSFNEAILYADPMIPLKPDYNDNCYFIVRSVDHPMTRQYSSYFGGSLTTPHQLSKYSLRMQPEDTGHYDVQLRWNATWWGDIYTIGNPEDGEKIRKFQYQTA